MSLMYLVGSGVNSSKLCYNKSNTASYFCCSFIIQLMLFDCHHKLIQHTILDCVFVVVVLFLFSTEMV